MTRHLDSGYAQPHMNEHHTQQGPMLKKGIDGAKEAIAKHNRMLADKAEEEEVEEEETEEEEEVEEVEEEDVDEADVEEGVVTDDLE